MNTDIKRADRAASRRLEMIMSGKPPSCSKVLGTFPVLAPLATAFCTFAQAGESSYKCCASVCFFDQVWGYSALEDWAGSVTEKQLPPSGLLATVMFPPWSITSSLAMLSPNPKCSLPLRALSAR